MNDWLWMTGERLGQGIAAGDIDPVDLTETYLAAIDAHELTPRIYARVTHDRARAEAKASSDRAKSGQRRSPLDGVPISWKDLFDTAGIATEAGTALMKDRVPTQDAEVLQNATAAGLICLGKTHMSEIAFSGLGLNPITATSPCVNDLDAVSGGSSSGAAASVAFGLAAMAVGSDTGGSVRIPSAWNDLTGLKTTIDRVSVKGVVPLCATFDTVGPLCRSVKDNALLLAAMEGSQAPDLTGVTLKNMHFAILDTIAMDDVRPQPLAAFQASVEKLKTAGATITQLQIPDLAEAFTLAGPLFTADSYAEWRDKVEANPEKMFPQILERVRAGAQVSAADYIAAWKRLSAIRKTYAQATAGYDAVIMPASPSLPPKIDKLLSDNDYYITENLLALRNTRVGNLMGSCSITLPTGAPSCGIMFNAGPMDEHRLLRIAAAAEATLS